MGYRGYQEVRGAHVWGGKAEQMGEHCHPEFLDLVCPKLGF